MRLLHISNDLYPRVTGGTEIFLSQLIEFQRRLPDTTEILWACHEAPLLHRDHDPAAQLSSKQRLLPPIQSGSRRQQVASTAAKIPGFNALLEEFRPDVVHLHSFSERCGLSHARAVKAFGARLVVTVHAPGFTCIKGNLIDAGGAICDGVMRERRCTRCRLNNGGLPFPLAGLVALQHGWPLCPEIPGALAHAFTARQLTASFQAAWRELATLADAIHVLAEWSRQVLLRNSAPEHKLHLIRTAGPPALPPKPRQPMEDGVLRLVNWGRCHPVKGLHLVINAIQAFPEETPIQLDFYGPYWDGHYGQSLQQRIRGDRRFRVQGNLPIERLLPRLQGYDMAVVPSTWLETGPLTVLEAFAAGLPVAGSDLGGIRELLCDAPSFLRVPLNQMAWMSLFKALISDPSVLACSLPVPAGFGHVAECMARTYQLAARV